MEKVDDMVERKELEEHREWEDLGPFGLLVFTMGVCLLAIPYLIMDLFDIASETTEYERRCI